MQEVVRKIDKNEELLVEQAKTDDTAFSELYDMYFPKIYGYVFKRVGNKQNAEDIVSTTFMKAFVALQKYENKKVPFGAWLFKIATNNLTDFYRSQARRKEVGVDFVPEIHDVSIDLSDSIDRDFDRKQLESVINRLPIRYKEVIEMKFIAELSNIEISKSLGYSPAHVGVLIYRALKKCNKLYEKHV